MNEKQTAVTKHEDPEQSKMVKLEERLLGQAQTPEERAVVFQQLSEYRQSQLIRQAATAIAEQSWGQNVSPVQCAALARYALETGTDPVRHWTFIAGHPYDLAELWMDLVASHPDFIRDHSHYLHDDDRLSEALRAERKQLRAQYGVPEGIRGAARVILYFTSRGPFEGVNWAGSRGKKKDPIGDEEPTKTALTRAYRKAAKKAVPLWFKKHPLFEKLEQLAEQAKASEHGAPRQPKGMFPANPDTPSAVEVEPGLSVRTSHTVGEIDADAAKRAYERIGE